MKQKTLNLAVIIMLTIGLNFANAQSLFVKELAGGETEHTLANITKLTFSGGNLVVNGADSGTYALTGLQKLTFQAGIIVDPPVTTCVNTNSDFLQGLTGWDNYVHTPASTTAIFAEVNGEYAITNITNATARWHAQISQNYNFVNGQTYTISFKARSITEKPIGILIRECVAGDCGTADSYIDKVITPTMDTYSFVYTQTEPSYAYGQLIFEVAENDSDIFFDDICISEGDNTLDIPKTEFKNTFSIYPNPVKDELSLNLPEAGNLDIYSLDGKLVMSKKITTVGSSTLNVANLTTGIYVCRYTNSKETKTVKLAKL